MMFAVGTEDTKNLQEDETKPTPSLSRKDSYFLELVSKTSTISESSDYSDLELHEGVLDNPVTKELLALSKLTLLENLMSLMH